MRLVLRESEELKEFREEQRRLQEKYHQMPMPIVTQWDVLSDENGKVLWASEIGLAKSWTRNAYNLMAEAIAFADLFSNSVYGDGYVSIKSTAGTFAAMTTMPYYIFSNTSDYIFVLLGSGNTAESFNDYALATPITNGAGAGQLTYGAKGFDTVWISGSRIMRTTITRAFTNGSGDTVSVAEKGLVANPMYRPGSNTSGLTTDVLLQRDILASPASVGNGETWTAAYQIDSPAFPS